MASTTQRFNLDTYALNDDNWSHTDTVEFVDEHSIDRGPVSERPTSGNYDDEFYYATDQNVLWSWDESITDWIIRGGTGSEEQPLDSVHTGTLSGDVVGRPEAITNLEGDLYLEPEGTDPGTVLQNDGDMVFIHE